MRRRRNKKLVGMVLLTFTILFVITSLILSLTNIIKQNPIILFLIIICIILAVLAYLLIQKIKSNELHENQEPEEYFESEVEQKLPYHSKYLLTKNEWEFYRKLKIVADRYNLHIIAKVRLADLVEVDNYLTGNAFNKYFWKIQAKHVDFVLCNPGNLAVIAVMEVDDSSHNTAERAIRDDFVDKVLTKCGYRIIHTYNGSNIENVLKYNRII